MDLNKDSMCLNERFIKHISDLEYKELRDIFWNYIYVKQTRTSLSSINNLDSRQFKDMLRLWDLDNLYISKTGRHNL